MLFSSSSSCSREKDDKIVSRKGYLAALKDRSGLLGHEHSVPARHLYQGFNFLPKSQSVQTKLGSSKGLLYITVSTERGS